MTEDASPPGRRPKPKRVRAGRGEITTQEALATELYTVIREALEQMGVDDKTQVKAARRARRRGPPVRASGELLRDTRGLQELLTAWSRSRLYLDRDGQPKVIPIEGEAPSFDALVRRFLPHLTTLEAIELSRRTTEIVIRPKGKIALLGGVFVSTAVTSTTLLAHTVRHIDQLTQTVLHNAKVHQNNLLQGGGRMERMVVGVIRQQLSRDFMEKLRPEIYDLLDRVDSAVDQRKPRTPEELKTATAVAVSVYVSEEPDFSRIGVDPDTVIPTDD